MQTTDGSAMLAAMGGQTSWMDVPEVQLEIIAWSERSLFLARQGTARPDVRLFFSSGHGWKDVKLARPTV